MCNIHLYGRCFSEVTVSLFLRLTKMFGLFLFCNLMNVNFLLVNAMDKSKTPVIMALDVETSGPNFMRNGLVSIGVSVQDMEMREICFFQKNLTLEEEMCFDPKCWDDFWSKQPDAYSFVTSNASDPTVVMAELSDFISMVETSYPQCFIVSDNPSFDIAWINSYLSRYTKRPPINYHTNGKYRMIWDSASVQKAWCGLRKGASFASMPSKHRELLGLSSLYIHDHNPLNDARTVASFFIQTWKQMETIGESMKDVERKVTVAKPLVIVKYDAGWPKFFCEEAEKIRTFMGDNVVDIQHVGSTSVPGLSAKPIVDMILVTNDLEAARLRLTSSDLGYRYKGEYNLPLRDLYGKNSDYEIYLHVHQVGSPEIMLNLLFRDFLIANSDAREQYEQVKIMSSQSSRASEKVETGITRYNLMKNDMIVSILQKTGFDGLCVRFATQHAEHEAFEQFRSVFFNEIYGNGHIESISQDTKKFVLYKGTEIIGSSALSDLGAGRFSIDFSTAKTKDGFLRLLQIMETWAKTRMHADSLFAMALKEQCELYLSTGFIALPSATDAKKINLFKGI